jgi:WD40 repeat protein
VTAVAFSPDGLTVAFGTAVFSRFDKGCPTPCHEVGLLDVASGTRAAALSGHKGPVNALAFSPDGKTLTTGSWEAVKSWDLTRGREARAWHVPGDVTTEPVQLSADGRFMSKVRPGGAASVYRLTEAATPLLLAELTGVGAPLTFAPDGRTLAAAGQDWAVRLWDVERRQDRGQLRGPGLPFLAIAISPDGNTLATGSTQGAVRLWDLTTGAGRSGTGGHDGMVRCLAFSADGAALASGGDDHTVRLWDVAGGAQRAVGRGHTAWVNALAFAPDGRTLASGSYDKTIRLWALGAGR